MQCAAALIDGAHLEGHWFDRTQEFAARLRREDIGRMRYATTVTVILLSFMLPLG